MFVFDQTEPTPVHAPIEIGESQFALLLNPPTIEQRVTDDCLMIEVSATGKANAIRAKTFNRLDCVSGWSDVNDLAGAAIPFTREAFLKLLGKCPAILDQLASPLNELFSGVASESVPNEQAA